MLEGKHILLVEDETLILMVLEDLLAEFGCHVAASAQSVEDALAAVRNTRLIDAAILDIEIGNEKCWPVAEALTARSVPFIFATGHGSDARIDPRFINARILDKPFDATTLHAALTSALSLAAPN